MARQRDSVRRFSNRVENYVRYRPGYPVEIVEMLHRNGVAETAVVADIGSGTGLLSEIFLEAGHGLYGVEPNEGMRAAGEEYLAQYERFHSVNGTAEETTLADESVDLIAAGQAFHWFNRDKTKVEFQRILRPGGVVALIWNNQLEERSELMQEYLALARELGREVNKVSKENAFQHLKGFFAPAEMRQATFANVQIFDWEGLRGRALSSSYMPLEGEANYERLIEGLRDIFERYQKDEKVQFPYRTSVFWGRWW